jgi:selenocysteine lyase/cysteine desulfurase
MVLNHFFSKPQSFNLVFTSNCSDSLNILSSSFAFETGGLLVFAKNSHTSVVGCRENARRRGGTFKCLTLEEMGRAEN